MKIITAVWLLVLGVLTGSSLGCHFLSALAVFDLVGGAVEDTGAAGTIAGEVFRLQHLFAVYTLPVLLVTWVWISRGDGKARWLVFGLLVSVIVLLAIEMLYITPGIHTLREELASDFGSISNAPNDDPLRREFGMLHGLSMGRALLEIILLAIGFVSAYLSLDRVRK